MYQKKPVESDTIANTEEEIIVISGDINASLGLCSLKILAKRRAEFLCEALVRLIEFQSMLLAKPRQFPPVEDLMYCLEYKHFGDLNVFALLYEKCQARDAKNRTVLLPRPMGKKFSTILKLIENKINLIHQELMLEDISQPLPRENKKLKKIEGHTVLDGLQVHYHNRVRLEAHEAQIHLMALRKKLAELSCAQEVLEKKLHAIETWLDTKPNMMYDMQRETLERECTDLKAVFDAYQQTQNAFNNACLSLPIAIPHDIQEKKDKLHWDSTPYSAKKDAINRSAQLLLEQYEAKRAKQIRKALRKRFFGTDEHMSHSIFGRYLDERAKTFSTRDRLSRLVFLFFCCFGYKTEASIRKAYIAKLKVEMNAYVADPKQALKLKNTVCNGIGMFSKKSNRGELSFASQLKKLKVSLPSSSL